MRRLTWAKWQTTGCIIGFCIVACAGCTSLTQWAHPNRADLSATVDKKSLVKSEATLAIKAAEMAEQQGRTDEAIRYYEQARTLDPQWNPVCRRLAVLYDHRGDDTRARQEYQEALALKPNDPNLLNDFGVFHLHREHWAEAESWFRRSLKAQPKNDRAAVNLGMSLAMQGRLDESYETFAPVVGSAAAYSNIGVLLSRQGRIDDARDYLNKAKSIDHQIQPAGDFLTHLDHPQAESPSRSPEADVPMPFASEAVGSHNASLTPTAE